MRKLLAPEVVQTSALDCGPAALKCLLEGFGIHASYGRLREACQTDLDGTSIDALEDAAVRLGLVAEQVMLPLDHLFLPEAGGIPAIVVVRHPNGTTHFVVVWRRHGPWLQVMDPAVGRRWVSCDRFREEVFVHSHPVPVSAWREWASSEAFLSVLKRRMGDLGLSAADGEARIAAAVSEEGWRPVALLDAAVRMTEAVARSGGVERGEAATRLLSQTIERGRDAAVETIPADFWTVRPAAAGEDLLLRGAVLLRAQGRRVVDADALPSDLAAALREPGARPEREMLRLVGADGLLPPLAVLLALFLAAAGVVLEAALFAGLLPLGGRSFGSVWGLLALCGGLLVLELPAVAGILSIGRRLETRLRKAIFRKLPRLEDRYFRSRLTSDMAERAHAVHLLRVLPDLAARWARATFEVVFTVAAIAWIFPESGLQAVFAAAASLALPLVAHPLLVEGDLRLRTHVGGLARFYLDALLGLVPLRLHGAGRAVRREHERLLEEWRRAGLRLQGTVVAAEGMQGVLGIGLAAWLVLAHVSRGGEAGAALLLAYWALNLPVLGQEAALLLRQVPACRNVVLRLLEPLEAPEEEAPTGGAAVEGPVAIGFEKVTLQVSGHTLIDGADLAIAAGSHVAIVGASGAGKSSLLGALLGWHRPVAGRVTVDGEALDGRALHRLRRATAWVEPGVQVWNATLQANVRYGESEGGLSLDEAYAVSGLAGVVAGLPEGVRTPLGEGGALVSGGEGQRVRFARALRRGGVRLALLDEPFRGLDREQRREMLAQARVRWKASTLLCATHDVGETLSFDRVLVVERGRVVEDGTPGELAVRQGSRYARMLAAERDGVWAEAGWRRVRLAAGRLTEGA